VLHYPDEKSHIFICKTVNYQLLTGTIQVNAVKGKSKNVANLNGELGTHYTRKV